MSSAIAPWLAPFAPAQITYTHMRDFLRFSWLVSAGTAFVIEILGLATISTAFMFWQHNKRERAAKNQVSLKAPILAFGWYLVVVMALVLLPIYPFPVEAAPYIETVVAFFLATLSVPAAVVLAVRAQHTELLAEISGRKTAGKSGKSTSQPNGNLPEISGSAQAFRKSRKADLADTDWAFIRQASTTEIAARCQVTTRRPGTGSGVGRGEAGVGWCRSLVKVNPGPGRAEPGSKQ